MNLVLVRATLVLCSIALPALAAEAYLRIHQPVTFRQPLERTPDDAWRELVHRKSSIPGLSYDLAPDRKAKSHGAVIETNRLGLRSYAPMSIDPKRTRIAVVGDSYAFGFGVAMHETFAAVMEQALNRDPRPTPASPGPYTEAARATLSLAARASQRLPEPEAPATQQYEVMNFGVGGYSTLDDASVVEHKVRAWKPALIVLAYSLNDPEDAPLQPVHRYYEQPALWQHSHVLRRVAEAYMKAGIAHYGHGDYHRYLHTHPAKWGTVERGFARIAQAARAMGAPVLLAIFPHFTGERWERYPYRDLHDRVAAAGRGAGFQVVDLLSTMQRYPPLQIRLSQRDDHPNRLGHQLAGEYLADTIVDRRLLDEP